MPSPYPNPFFWSDLDRIGYYTDSNANTDFLGRRKLYRFRPVSEWKRIFLSRIICAYMLFFYNEKQFINQSHKAAIQHEIITVKHHFDLRAHKINTSSQIGFKSIKQVCKKILFLPLGLLKILRLSYYK
jgi:hypothetical protein